MTRHSTMPWWDRFRVALFSVWLIAASASLCLFDIGGTPLPELALLGLVASAGVGRPAPLAGPVVASLAVLAYAAAVAPRALHNEASHVALLANMAILFATGLFAAMVVHRFGLPPIPAAASDSPSLADPPGLSSRDPVLRELIMRRAIVDEVSRARRYRHELSLVVVAPADWSQLSSRIGAEAANRLLELLGRALYDLVRDVDRVGMHAAHEFIILLPETGRAGAEVVARKIGSEVQRRVGIAIATGIAVYPAEASTAEELASRAHDALRSEIPRIARPA